MDTPEILYHYTDAKGLYGILNTKQIWASSYRFMSDSQEFNYGFDLISELFPGQLPIRTLGLDFSENSAELSFAEVLRRKKDFYDLDILFIASFSAAAKGDSLGQWRGYAGLHSGYSLGFCSNDLKSINSETRLIACCYDKTQQKNELKKLIDKYLSIAKEQIKSDSHDPSYDPRYDSFYWFTRIASEHAVKELAPLCAKFKHLAFEEEKEWRLVVGPLPFNDDRICYRDSERVIIPYVKIDFSATGLPLKRIIVGPGPHKERNAQSLRQMLIRQGLQDVEVSLSEVPFRTW